MSAHRRAMPPRTKLRRTATAALVAVASSLGFFAAAGPAAAAGPWFVAPLGLNTNNCLSAGTPCATVTGVLAKAGFVDGDVINVANGTYLDRPLFQAKTADVRGAGAGTIFNGSATSWGMASAIGNAKTLRLSNLRITNGKTATGAGLPIASGQVIATDVTINGNNATTNANGVGGGTYVAAGASLTMNNGSLATNTANAGGGAAYVVAGGTLSLNNTAVSSNSAPVAGGVYNLGTTSTTGGTFNANSSGFGGALATAGTATISGTAFTSNPSSNQGGAVFANTGTLTVNGGSTFSGNTAVSGGAIFQQAGTTNVSQSTSFANNSATNGGAVFQVNGAMNLGNSTFTLNNATNQGGAVYSANGTVSSSNASFQTNTAGSLGGAVTVAAGTANLTGGGISGNSALNAGGLYNGGTTTLDGLVLTSNSANGGTTSNGGNAGAIYNSAALIVKNSTFNFNKAVANTNATPGVTGYGGAIASFSLAAAGAPTLTFTNTTINGDNGGTPVSGGNATIGGAIAALGNIGAGGSATVLNGTGLTLSKNVALAGGGIYASGPVTLTNSTVTQNKATHASAGLGGGIYTLPQVASSTLTLDNTDVTGNDGTAGGGGIVTTMNAVVKNGSAVNNNTGAIGAGIYTAAPVSVTSSEVKGNSASNSGGGIYAAAAVTLADSSIDDNTAAFLGGGLSTTETAGSFAMTGGTLSGNNAFGGGGAFIGSSLNASFDDTDLIGNTSTGANFGGGAVLSAGQVSINKAQILDNKADGASGLGGALFSGTADENITTSLKVTNSTLSGNEAFAGSAVWAGSSKPSSTNKTSISNSTITGNVSQSAVGAVQVYNGTSVTGSTITDNTASGGANAIGGLVGMTANLVSLSGSILSGNSGHQCATAVNDGGSNLLSPNDATCALSAAPAKGNVFAAPQLGALANNGGPTKTLLPGPTSPALDKISASTGTGVNDALTGNAITLCGAGATDQRGTSRPQGAKCDIGAVEADQIVPTLSGPSSATYSVGVAGAPQEFTSAGSPQPVLSATGLPNGVTFTDHGDGTGTLAGTPGPNTGGVHAITVKATNEAGSDSIAFTLTITQAPALAGPTGATYTVGQPGGPTTFTSTGHPTPALSSLGVLPAGVGFTDNGDGSGAYAGTPGAGTGGVYNLTVKAANGTPPDATAPFALTVNQAPALAGPSAANFTVGTSSDSGEYVGTGFPVPTLSATGLPSGLSLVGTGAGEAKISGSAANGTGGVYPGVVVKAANGVGSDATQNVTVTVNEAPELVGPTEARWVTGTANSIGFSSDGFPQAVLTYAGTLPAGLSFVDNGNGSATISGTAPANAVGSYTITVTASNGQSPDATKSVLIEVVPPLSISTTSLPNAAYKTAYSAQVTASGGQPAYSFEIVSGALPAGLSMNSFGLITGSATAATGTFTFTVKVIDSLDPAQTATKQLSITLVKGNTQMDVTAIISGVQPNGDLSINVGLVEADIRGGFPLRPVSGASVVFKSGTKTVCTGISNAAGHAQCSQNLLDALLTPLKGSLTATFAGNATWNGSSATAGAFQPGSSGSGGGGNLLTLLLGG